MCGWKRHKSVTWYVWRVNITVKVIICILDFYYGKLMQVVKICVDEGNIGDDPGLIQLRGVPSPHIHFKPLHNL